MQKTAAAATKNQGKCGREKNLDNRLPSTKEFDEPEEESSTGLLEERANKLHEISEITSANKIITL